LAVIVFFNREILSMVASLSVFHTGMLKSFLFSHKQLKSVWTCMADVIIYEKFAEVKKITLLKIPIKKIIF
jgi:hypothetical protein